MSLERLNLYNPVQEQLNVLRNMRRYHQEMQDADTVASFNVQFADSLEVVESESVQPVQNVNVRKVSRKDRRSVRIDCNKSHKGSDRAHGKKRMPSAKFVREADSQNIYHAHAKFVWHENHKGEWIPRTVRKHDKFHHERFMPSPDWDGTPDPLMPAERLERNQQIEQLKNQLDITDWEMRDVTDRIQWCREDIEEIEYFKSKEAETRQSLKEWQDRLATLSREYHDLTERIMNLSV